jgi:hypothetical protein
LGTGIRLHEFLNDRTLWLDEARLALNVVNRSYLQLLQPLDYDQGAPIAFLFFERLIIQLLGNNEHNLRRLPFIASIASFFSCL